MLHHLAPNLEWLNIEHEMTSFSKECLKRISNELQPVTKHRTPSARPESLESAQELSGRVLQ